MGLCKYTQENILRKTSYLHLNLSGSHFKLCILHTSNSINLSYMEKGHLQFV